MKQITTYCEAGRKFFICKETGHGEANGYWAFEDKDVDENGRLKKQFNGITGHHSKTLAETKEKVSNKIKVDVLVANGMDLFEACQKVIMGA